MGMDPTKKTRGVATEITALWMDLDVWQGCVDVGRGVVCGILVKHVVSDPRDAGRRLDNIYFSS